MSRQEAKGVDCLGMSFASFGHTAKLLVSGKIRGLVRIPGLLRCSYKF